MSGVLQAKEHFGTDELVHRIEAVGLNDVVTHHTLIVPQLGATEEMRRVRFTLSDRIVLIPVEMTNLLIPMLITSVILALAGNYTAAAAIITAAFTGLVLFPILLPWIPSASFFGTFV